MPEWDIDTAIRWLDVGQTFYIPCLDTTTTKKKIKEAANAFGVKVIMRTVIENGIRGVRVWRR